MRKGQEHNKYMSLYPKFGVVNTGVKERAMGRLLSVPVKFYSRQAMAIPSQSVIDLASDVFFSLYKAEPELEENPPISRYLNNALLRLLHSVPSFETLRSNTTANIPVAMHTTAAMTNTLLSDESIIAAMRLQELLERLMEQLASMQSQSQQGMQPPEGGEGAGDQGGEEGQKPQPQAGGGQPNEEDEERLRQKIEDVERQLEQKANSIAGSQLSHGMASTVVDQGREWADEMSAVMTTWGAEAGTMSYKDANKIVKIANDKRKTLKMISEVGGRLVGVSMEAMQAVRDSYVGAPSEPTYTRDIMRIFPMDRAYLSPQSPPFMRANKVVQWAQRGLLGLRPKSEGKKRGALVIAVDGSSSMTASLCTTIVNGRQVAMDREDVAKVLATGVARAMREDRVERRKYTMFTFGTEDDPVKKVTSADSWEKMIDWISFFPNGGTDFDLAFDYALDEMERFESEGTLGADLLFISDGEARLQPEGQERLKAYRDRTGARVFYLQVTSDYGARSWNLKKIGLEGLVDASVLISSSDAREFDDVPTYLAQQVSKVFTQVD
jgi:uncharacterized protein with von Willebrand factor type A (vWA) domain